MLHNAPVNNQPAKKDRIAVRIRSSAWLGIRRIINDLRAMKKKMKNRSKIVDSLTISGYGLCVMSEAQ